MGSRPMNGGFLTFKRKLYAAFVAGTMAVASALALPAVASTASTASTRSTPSPAVDQEAMWAEGKVPPAYIERDRIWSSFRSDIAKYVDDGDIGVVADVDGAPSNFGSFVIDEANLDATIYWAGEPPRGLISTIADHPQVTVTFLESAYSLRELIEARDAAVKGEAPDGTRLVAASPASDASALQLSITSESGADLSDTEVAAAAAHYESLVGVKVHLEAVGENYSMFAAARQDDETPFYGSAGLRLTRPQNTTYCSSGAGVEGRSSGESA